MARVGAGHTLLRFVLHATLHVPMINKRFLMSQILFKAITQQEGLFAVRTWGPFKSAMH
jgi:hypothetical protein